MGGNKMQESHVYLISFVLNESTCKSYLGVRGRREIVIFVKGCQK